MHQTQRRVRQQGSVITGKREREREGDGGGGREKGNKQTHTHTHPEVLDRALHPLLESCHTPPPCFAVGTLALMLVGWLGGSRGRRPRAGVLRRPAPILKGTNRLCSPCSSASTLHLRHLHRHQCQLPTNYSKHRPFRPPPAQPSHVTVARTADTHTHCHPVRHPWAITNRTH